MPRGENNQQYNTTNKKLLKTLGSFKYNYIANSTTLQADKTIFTTYMVSKHCKKRTGDSVRGGVLFIPMKVVHW